MQKVAIMALVLGLIGACAFAQGAGQPTGAVQGLLFTADADGGRSVVPAAKISLDGPVHLEVHADNEGKFACNAVPPGSYRISAEATGLAATQNVIIRAATVSEIALEMKIQAATESTTVTASAEPADTREPSGTNIVGDSAVRNMPNIDEQFQSLLPLIPGVVRGPNGLINMKGARASQNGSLVNSADVTDPATGTTAINIPIDVVSSIHVLSTPYDPEYGKFTGAVSNVETRSGDFNKFRLSGQNFIPRLRRIDGSIVGIAAFTPRITFSGPIVKDRVAFTQSFEYRYERDPVDSLPPLQSYNRSENFNSYTQFDVNISQKQTASASFAIFPQRLDYYGLNTFTPQPSTPDLNERGYQAYLQHRYVTDSGDLLTSQVSFRRFNADLVPNSNAPYELLVETTEGGFFNHQNRNTTRTEWEEIFRSHPRHFFGSHELDAGVDFAHSSYDGRQQFLPVQIFGVAGYPLEQIQFGPTSTFSVDQNETAWFVGKIWVDANDYSIVRIEGRPARNPSFWVRNVHFVHTYQKVGSFWFASATHTKSEIRIFGSSELTIENSGYTLNPPIDHITEADRQARLIQ